jgi:hypothetical protein
MRTTRLGLTVAALLAVAACSPGEPAATAAVDGDLRRDLSLAEAHTGSITLPGTRRTEVVSEAELTPRVDVPVRAAPSPRARRQARVKRPAVRAVARRAPAPIPAPEPAPAPAEVEAVAVVAAAEPEPTPAPAPEAVIPNRAPRRCPRATSGHEPREERPRGVVIRGGGVDGDHCERDRMGRGRFPGGLISINVQGPIGRGTFPRY